MALKHLSAYRMVGTKVAWVLAGVSPISLLVEVRLKKYTDDWAGRKETIKKRQEMGSGW